MKTAKTICLVEDEVYVNSLLCAQLAEFGFKTLPFYSVEEFLEAVKSGKVAFDAIVTDVYLKDMSGFDLCRAIRAREAHQHVPIIMITGDDLAAERLKSIAAGADDFISKPLSALDLYAKLEEARAEKRCSVPGAMGSPDGDLPLTTRSSRRHISVVFVDLRNFTAFTESSAPEAVMEVINRYYSSMRRLAKREGGIVGSLVGDGIAVFFGSPGAWRTSQEAAAMFALTAREDLAAQKDDWSKSGYELDYGIALAEGYATIGVMGCEYIRQYTIIGAVMNLASRLCALAKEGKILVSHRFFANLQDVGGNLEGSFELKGVMQPVSVYSIFRKKGA